MTRPSNIVILGGTGFIGSTLARRFEGIYPITVLGSKDGDLSNRKNVEALVERYVDRKSIIIFAAAKVRRDGDTFEAAQQNVCFAANLRQALAGREYQQLVVLSTVDVYGPQDEAIEVGAPLKPTGFYGYAKCCVEYNLIDAVGQLAPLILRLPGVYGYGDRQKSVVGKFIQSALTGMPVTINGDGEQTREYLYADDMAVLILKALDHRQSGIFNVNPSEISTINDVVSAIEGATGVPMIITYDKDQKELPFPLLQPSKLAAHFPNFRFTPLDKAVAAYIRQAKEENDLNVLSRID